MHQHERVLLNSSTSHLKSRLDNALARPKMAKNTSVQGEVANMASQLGDFASSTSQGVEHLRRALQSKPCIGRTCQLDC